jgi:hypothetical protein
VRAALVGHLPVRAMTNATSERTLYIGLYLPTQSEPTTAAIMKLRRIGNSAEGHFAYGHGYLGNRAQCGREK